MSPDEARILYAMLVGCAIGCVFGLLLGYYCCVREVIDSLTSKGKR
jgi:ABC-type nitrate/sulfonate/bicarbonate transport system permease component